MSEAEKQQEQTDLERMARIAVVDQLAHLGKYSLLTSALVGLLVYAVFHEHVNPLLLNLWLLALAILVFARILMITRFWRMDLIEQNLRRWIRSYMALSFLSAACWGALPLFDVFIASEWIRTFIVFVVTGMSTGGVVTLFPLLRAAIPFILITLTPLLIVLTRGDDPSLLYMAMMTGLYIVMLVRTTYVLNRSIAQAIRLRIENKELFKFLKITRPEGSQSKPGANKENSAIQLLDSPDAQLPDENQRGMSSNAVNL